MSTSSLWLIYGNWRRRTPPDRSGPVLDRGAAGAGSPARAPGPERAGKGPAGGARAAAICFRLNGDISDLTSGWDRPRLSLQSALYGVERGQDQSIPPGKLRPELPFG